VGQDERVVAEHQAVLRQRGGVDACRHRRVHAGQRIGETRTEGPADVTDGVGEPVVGGALVIGHHMCGTSSGMA
jgi:hypothetical protein